VRVPKSVIQAPYHDDLRCDKGPENATRGSPSDGRSRYFELVIRSLRSTMLKVVHGETTIWPSMTCGVAVAGISYLIGANRGNLSVDVALASMTTFLFGVLLAFAIARTRERLAVVQDLVSKGNASVLAIHRLVEVFADDRRREIRELIDRYLTDEIDYRLVDNYRASGSRQSLAVAVYALDPQSPRQEIIYKQLVEVSINMGADSALMESTTGQALSPIEWTGILLLLALLIALIAVLPGGTILGSLVAGLLAGTLITLTILLRKLDLLRWHERDAIWEPTARVFRSMGREPYVPRFVIENGRYRPQGRIRVVDFPHPYPDRSEKIVTVVDLDLDLDLDLDRSGVGEDDAEH
jgi:hypothetical protein